MPPRFGIASVAAIYPENGWSFGLGAALRAPAKNDEASAVDARFKSALGARV